MSNFVNNLTPKGWEEFCEIMLRRHYGVRNFWSVPDQDSGDFGLEFFTIDGTLFQCYFPEQGIEMSEYKRRIQNKINVDLKKLKEYESEIAKLLDQIVIDQWILLIPENKSKDLISYCNKKKKEIITKNISYIDNKNFIVKIETADSYREGKIYAQSVHPALINIPITKVTDADKSKWLSDNSVFSSNINRKSDTLMKNQSQSSQFKEKVIERYIQIDKFLEQLRDEHPDLYQSIEDSAMAQLGNLNDTLAVTECADSRFVQNILDGNKQAFAKHSKFMSDTNTQSLSFGFLSKWLAECYIDFK